MELIKLEFFRIIADNLLIILITAGGFLLHLFEYFMGKTKYGSLLEFILSLVKKDEPKA